MKGLRDAPTPCRKEQTFLQVVDDMKRLKSEGLTSLMHGCARVYVKRHLARSVKAWLEMDFAQQVRVLRMLNIYCYHCSSTAARDDQDGGESDSADEDPWVSDEEFDGELISRTEGFLKG